MIRLLLLLPVRFLAVAMAIGVLVGCSAPAREERGLEEVTTAAPTTATAAASTGAALTEGCGELEAVPAGASSIVRREEDLDVDGRADVVTTYAAVERPGRGDWRLRVELGRGGGSELVVAEDPAPGAVTVLGSARLGLVAQAEPVLFVWTSSGASARSVTLFALDGCQLSPLTRQSGGEATFLVGGSAAHQEGVRCDTTDDGNVVTEITSEAVAGGYEIIEQTFTKTGNTLTVAPSTRQVLATPPPEAGRIDGCGSAS